MAVVRREAGVDDPYWVLLPRWKLGDPVSPEARTLEVQKQVDDLTGDLGAVKRVGSHHILCNGFKIYGCRLLFLCKRDIKSSRRDASAQHGHQSVDVDYLDIHLQC